MRTSSYFTVFALIALTTACASKNIKPPCPQVAIVRALETFNDYGNNAIDPSNLVAVAKMDDVVGTCEYNDDGVDIGFTVSMRALKGKRLGGTQVSMPYFVSVVSDNDDVYSKELMTAKFVFDKTPIANFEEQLHIKLPYMNNKKLTGMRVLLGFQLTKEQLSNNVK